MLPSIERAANPIAGHYTDSAEFRHSEKLTPSQIAFRTDLCLVARFQTGKH